LLDTGSQATCISADFYTKLRFGVIGPTHEKAPQIVLRSSTRELTGIKGTTKIRVWVTDNNFYDLDAMIIKDMCEDVILGFDFLGSKRVEGITNTHLHLFDIDPDTQLPYQIPIILDQRKPLVRYKREKPSPKPRSLAQVHPRQRAASVPPASVASQTETRVIPKVEPERGSSDDFE
jgi:hypothetical protein